MAMGMQQNTAPIAMSAKTKFAGQPKARLAAAELRGSWPLANDRSGAERRNIAASGAMMEELADPEPEHGRPPAGRGDDALEDRRPDRACHISAARNERERRAAMAVEPAADINVERRVHAADAKKSHQQALSEIKLPRARANGKRKAGANHDRAEDDGEPGACPLCHPAHHHTTGGEADPGQRACQGRHTAQSAVFRGDSLERDDENPGRAEGQRQDEEHDGGNDPG